MDYNKILPYLFEGAYVVNESREIVAWNQIAETITGYKANEVIGKHCFDNILRHVNDEGKLLCHEGCPLEKSIQSGDVLNAVVSLHHKEGYRIPVSVRTIPFKDEKTNKRMAFELFIEHSKTLDASEENKSLKLALQKDGLTNLYNRKFLDYQLDISINEYHKFGTSLAVLFLDIDHFKKINDHYGHDFGDQALKALAKTLSLNIRHSDYAVRYGGEEFIVLLRGIDYDTMRLMASRLRRLVEKMSIPLNETKNVNMTVSIGGALYHKDHTAKSLLDLADKKMYEAKQNGRNKVICSTE